MKRKAQSQLQKAPTTTLAKSNPPKALRGTAKTATKQSPAAKKTKQPVKKVPVKEDSESERDEDDEDVSSGEDIGDIDEYLKEGEDESSNVVLDFDDGEVSFNLPQKKKMQLLGSDDEDEDEKMVTKKGASFSDDNTKWLKSADGDSDEEGDDSDEMDSDIEAMNAKLKAKQDKIAADLKIADDDFKQQIAEQEEEESDEEEEEDIQDVANRMENLNKKIQDSVGILNEWRERKPDGVSREEFVTELKSDLMNYFGYTNFLMDLYFHLFTPAEALSHIEANEVPRPMTIRVNTLKAVRKDLAQTLINKGVSLKPIKWSKVGLVIYESKIPIGATPEYLAGQYMLQSAASFLPVLALEPQPNEQVLDMCAAPGGKTTYIAGMMKNTGTIHANDKNPDRIHALVANIHRMGVKNCVVSNLDGCDIPKLPLKFDRVLLDAPCMGLGVIAKDRSIKSTKEERDMINCIDIQIKLLLAAIDAVDISKAAVIVYSTCSISVEENEAIVNKALKKRFVKVVDSGLEFGKEGFTRYRGKEFHPSLKLARRYYPHAHNIDGFFVCKLHKYANGVKNSTKIEEVKQVAEVVDKKAPVAAKKNAAPVISKKKSAQYLILDDATHVAFDPEKENQRAQKSKEKRNRKKQNRLARMRVSAHENGEEEDMDEEMEEEPTIPPPPSSTPKANGNAKGSAPQKKLRGSKQ